MNEAEYKYIIAEQKDTLVKNKSKKTHWLKINGGEAYVFVASMGKELEVGEVFSAKWGFILPLIS